METWRLEPIAYGTFRRCVGFNPQGCFDGDRRVRQRISQGEWKI